MSEILVIINQLERDGKLSYLIKNGVIDPKVLSYREIYLYVDSQFILHNLKGKRKGKCNSVNKMTVITWAEEKFNIKSRTIYKALKFFAA